MAPQLYLITPAAADPETFPATLMAVLDVAEFSALLVRRGALDDAGYAKLAANLVNVGQGAGCAVLVEDDPALAKRLGADGVHVNGGAVEDVEPTERLAEIRRRAEESKRAHRWIAIGGATLAVAALKPNLIVGAGNIGSRHDAMTAGEMDVDYLLFGPLEGAADPASAELAEWWAATFEIPAVLSDPQAGPGVDSRGAEFLALSTSLWSAASPAAAATAIVNAIGETA